MFQNLITQLNEFLSSLYPNFPQNTMKTLIDNENLKYEVCFNASEKVNVTVSLYIEDVPKISITTKKVQIIEGDFKTPIDLIKYIENNHMINIIQLDPEETDPNILNIEELSSKYKITFKEEDIKHTYSFQINRQGTVEVTTENTQKITIE